MILQEKTIEMTIYALLEDIVKIPRSAIRRVDFLVRDLHMDSDDFSFLFVPELEKRLGIHVPVQAWSTVYSVDDTIHLLKQYMEQS